MKKKRGYNSESRIAQAERTRSQILEAAKQLFQTIGFDKVTVDMLAKRAAVSMPTIYAVFKSKRGVLQALIDDALPAEQFTALVEGSMQEQSPKKCLFLTAKLARHLYDAEKGVMDILRGASVVAPELRELEQERERRRYKRQGEYVKKLMKNEVLAKRLTLQKARDILWTLTGRDIYRMLVIERSWSSDEYERWLAEALVQALLQIDV